MISQQTILKYIAQKYAITPDYPFTHHPTAMVLRHIDNKRKWFALIMDVPVYKHGLSESSLSPIINLKCPTEKIDCLLKQEGTLPAYHMNKKHWISIRLESQFSQEQLFPLIDQSYQLTSQ